MSRAWIRSRRLWITLSVVVFLALAYTLFGFYGVPRLADHLIRAQVAKLGHKVELGAIQFHPFRFEAQIEGLHLSEADGAPLLGFNKLEVDLELWDSIRERGAVLGYLRLASPDVSLVVEPDGRVNLSKLVPAATEPASEKNEPSAIPRIRIGEFVVSDGRIGVEDRSRPRPFATELRPLAFNLRDFRTELGHANLYEFSGAASTGERIGWTGEFTVQPLGSRGHFSIENVQASTVTAYLQDGLPIRLVSGVAETAGDYTLRLDPVLDVEVSLPRLLVRDAGLAEYGTKSSAASVSASEIALSDIKVTLSKREARVGGVDLRGLRTKLRREADGSINLTKLVAPAKPGEAGKQKPPTRDADKKKPASTPASASAPAWRATVGGVRVHAARIDAEDQGVQPPVRITLAPIDIEVGPLTSDLSDPLALKAGLGIGKNGRLDANGTLRLDPLSAKVKLDAKRLDLSMLQPYIAPHTGVDLKSAQLGVGGTVDWAQSPAKLEFEGDALLANLALRDRAQKRDLLGFEELKVAGIAYSQQKNRLGIQRVDLVAPTARVEISPERELNVTRALAAPGAPKKEVGEQAPTSPSKTAQRKEAEPALAVQLKTLRIDRGMLDFADRSIDPQFAAAIQKLEGRIDGLSSDPDASATVDLKGQVDAFSPVLIKGELNPFAYDRDTTLALSFRNMDLIRFNPYSGRFAGYNIVKGKLTTELKYRIEKRALQAEHHVIIDQLEFGDATGSKDAVPLPVKLAVALLKDRHGTIDLELPVSGDLDDPTFRVGPVVWKVLVNLMSKAVTAPFAALGRLFGGSAEELQFVTFEPGQSELDAAQKDQLEKLSKALVERPQLKLDVPYALADDVDADALARAALRTALVTEKPPKDDEDRLDALVDLHKQRLGTDVEFPDDKGAEKAARTTARIAFVESALLRSLKPDTPAMETLAAERARAVQTVLLAQPDLAPERVFLTSRTGGIKDDGGRVRMELKLQ
jgi:uncharacterized protein involved in outer membrane biogenesis